MNKNLKFALLLVLMLVFALGLVACNDSKNELQVPDYVAPAISATYGQTLAELELPVGFSWEEELSTSVGDVGSHVFHVTYTPSDTSAFQTVTGIEVTVTVSKGTPTPSTVATLNAVYGQTLADVSLPAHFSWLEATTTSVGDAGDHVFHVVFTPEDTTNYNTVRDIPVTVRVAKATYDMSGVSFDNSTFAFDGLTKSLAISGALPEGVSVSYDNNYQKDPGNHTIVAHFVGDDNHEPIADMTATLSIAIDEKTAFGNLPVIYINTQNNVFPYDKETYINCSFKLTNTESYNMDLPMKESIDDSGSIGIRLRGNSTLTFPKKAFRVKFDKKQSVFGMTKAKSWVLLADYIDKSAIRNYVGLSIANYSDALGFTPSPNHVVVFINGQYQGLYLLTQQIDEKQGRTDVEGDLAVEDSKDYPFLVEMDYYSMDSVGINPDVFDVGTNAPIEIKYPDYDDRTKAGAIQEENDAIRQYIIDYFVAIGQTVSNHDTVKFNGNDVAFSDLVDEDSFIDHILVELIMQNVNSSDKDIYFYKSQNGKAIAGPVWDFDAALTLLFEVDYNRINYAEELLFTEYNWYSLRYIQDQDNYVKVQTRYNLLYDSLTNDSTGINVVLRDYKAIINNAAIVDANYWYGDNGGEEYDTAYDFVRLFLQDRLEFLKYAFSLSHEEFLQLHIWE